MILLEYYPDYYHLCLKLWSAFSPWCKPDLIQSDHKLGKKKEQMEVIILRQSASGHSSSKQSFAYNSFGIFQH